MKGKINADGNLEIDRGRGFILVICPWDSRATKDIPVACGEHCAFFGEPEDGVKAKILKMGSLRAPGARPGQVPAEAVYGISLQTCRQQPLFFDEFSDNRL